MQTEVQQKIRALIGKFGLKLIRETVEAESRSVYEYLHPIYGVASVPIPNVILVESLDCFSDTISNGEKECLSQEDTPNNLPNEEGVKTVVVTGAAAGVKLSKEDNKAKREKHEADIQAKRKEYEEKGVQPESLLTKENLASWLKEGKTYWEIAEATGCKDSEVSAKAKGFGLQSQMSKYIIAKRAAKTKA